MRLGLVLNAALLGLVLTATSLAPAGSVHEKDVEHALEEIPTLIGCADRPLAIFPAKKSPYEAG